MSNQSSNAFSLHADDLSNVVSFDKDKVRKYNPQAAYYALPKAFINRLLFQISGSTLKVFLALVNHTDCWNTIRYPDKITHSGLMKTTGIKKKDTITKAYRELRDLGIIGGYVPGHGSENTKFYFTFDIDHYRTDECCLELEEISSYYEMLLSGKHAGPVPEEFLSSIPEDNSPDSNSANPESEDVPCDTVQHYCTDDSSFKDDNISPDPGPLTYAVTIANSWGTETRLFTGKDPGLFLYEDGSVFCTKSEFVNEYKQYVVSSSSDLNLSSPASDQDAAPFDSLRLRSVQAAQGSKTSRLPGGAETGTEFPKNGTPSPLKMVPGSPEKRDSLKTINNYKINNLIVNAKKDFKFKFEFNEFCTDDTSKYLKNTLFWIAKNAADFDLSLGDVIDSLSVANDKGKQGSMCYLIGIMRNKAGNNANGIGVITKPVILQAKQYFQERFSHCLEHLKSYDFDPESNQLQYTLKDPQKDRVSMNEFFKFVVDDIKKAVGISLSYVEIF